MVWSLIEIANDNKGHPYAIPKKERKKKSDNKMIFFYFVAKAK